MGGSIRVKQPCSTTRQGFLCHVNAFRQTVLEGGGVQGVYIWDRIETTGNNVIKYIRDAPICCMLLKKDWGLSKMNYHDIIVVAWY